MSLLNLAVLASEEVEGAESIVPLPTWVYGVATLIIFLLLLWLVTRLNSDV
jgi:hypothetical protein